jgi:head-tail adaptor
MATKKIRIAELKHHVALCSMKDVVTEGGEMVLIRSDVLKIWCKIESRSASFASPSMYGQAGYAILENRDRQTHVITMPMRRDFDISSAAWIYEQRLQSGARWYKVLGIRELNEDGQYMVLSARLIERGDDLTPPVAASATPEVIKAVDSGVKL